MIWFLVMLLSDDCNGYVFGVYPTATQACAARERCAEHTQLWQQQDPGVCIVQRFAAGVDDAVEDVVCGSEAGERLF